MAPTRQRRLLPPTTYLIVTVWCVVIALGVAGVRPVALAVVLDAVLLVCAYRSFRLYRLSRSLR